MKPIFEEVDEAEVMQFKKKLAKLRTYQGRGTELISLYLPPDVDRSSVMGQITEETSQSSNIKSPSTRKNVQGALRKINNFLKQIDFKLPKQGLGVFCGNISETEGKSNIQLMTLRPPMELKVKLYRCDSKFFLEPMNQMIKPNEIYALATIDKNEATIALLTGKKYEILGHFTSGVAGKSRAGGQSAKRFEHLREEAAQDFYKRISEKINDIFLKEVDKLKGLIIGGPGMTKTFFLNKNLIDHRLKNKLIGIVDIAYTDDSGIREMVNKSEKLLKDTDIMREKSIINSFMESVVKNDLGVYGKKETEEAIMLGKVDTLLISEELGWMVYRYVCTACGEEKEITTKEPHEFDHNKVKCAKCNSEVELLEEVDYIDHMIEKAKQTDSKIKLISTDTPEGEQFLTGFGGIGAILRYK